jgi:hypothetical protein
MEEKPMQLSEKQKRGLQFLIDGKMPPMSENSQRYAKAMLRKILDERADRQKAESLNQTQTLSQTGKKESEAYG